MLPISKRIAVADNEIEIRAVRSGGPGGQHVNKVSTAVQIRFDITKSSLPEQYKRRLMALNDRRITANGIIVIRAGQRRSQKQNRDLALERLRDLIRSVFTPAKIRKATNPTAASRRKRLETKSRQSMKKAMRGKIHPDQE